MYKIFSFLALVLLCTKLLYSQAAVNIPLIISDDMNNSITLYFGLDLTATSGIDPALGESDLPPFPPAGAFEARFDLAPYTGLPLSSYKDYRNVQAFPWWGLKQHRLVWQLGEGADSLFITYNLPTAYPYHITMEIKDEFGGVLVNSGILFGSGTFTIGFPITAVRITLDYFTPVELLSFNGIQAGSGVKLTWITASEINNKGFGIERKIQDAGWETISFIEGHGTTTEEQSYSYIDDFSNNIITSPIYYRLKQIDFDGTAEYSDELKVDVVFTPDNFVLDQNYPNPFNPNTKINYSIPDYSNVVIKIFDILGNEMATLIDEEKPPGRYEITWDAANLPSGIYFYQLNARGFVETKKMTLMK